MKSFFDLIAPVYKCLHIRAKKTARRIGEIANFTLSDVVVDVGGGVGRIAKVFIGKVQSMTVVDVSEGMIAECRKHDGLTCIVGRAEALPFGDASVDVVLIVDAFHHMTDPHDAIADIHRVLKPGGRLIMEEFDPTKWGGKAIVILERIFRLGSTFYPPAVLAKMFGVHFTVSIIGEGKGTYYLVAKKN